MRENVFFGLQNIKENTCVRKAPHSAGKVFCCWAHSRGQGPRGWEGSGCGHVLSHNIVSHWRCVLWITQSTGYVYLCLDLGADLLTSKLISICRFTFIINFCFRKEIHQKLKPSSLPKGKSDYWVQEELALLRDTPRWHARVNGSVASLWRAELWSQRACAQVSALPLAKVIKWW